MMLRLLSVLLLAFTILTASCRLPNDVQHYRAEGALGPYSAAVESAPFVFVSGKIGERGGTFAREARTTMEAVAAELAKRDLTFSDVVSATVYLTDMERYGEFNAIYAEFFEAPKFPARACVAVAALPAGARCEVQVVARRR